MIFGWTHLGTNSICLSCAELEVIMADEMPKQKAVELTDELRGWINEQLSVEVKRVESMGSKCLPVPVFDFCTEQGDEEESSQLVHVITAKTK